MKPALLAGTLDRVTERLPREFPFYHLGHARINPTPSRTLGENASLIGYRVTGEPSFWIVLAHEKELEFSIYSELGNILASRWVGDLSEALNQEFLLSHPIPISWNTLQTTKLDFIPLVRRHYVHSHEAIEIPVEFWVLPHTQERIGHA